MKRGKKTKRFKVNTFWFWMLVVVLLLVLLLLYFSSPELFEVGDDSELEGALGTFGALGVGGSCESVTDCGIYGSCYQGRCVETECYFDSDCSSGICTSGVCV